MKEWEEWCERDRNREKVGQIQREHNYQVQTSKNDGLQKEKKKKRKPLLIEVRNQNIELKVTEQPR